MKDYTWFLLYLKYAKEVKYVLCNRATSCYAKVIYPLFMKRASLHKKGIDYLSINYIHAYLRNIYIDFLFLLFPYTITKS